MCNAEFVKNPTYVQAINIPGELPFTQQPGCGKSLLITTLYYSVLLKLLLAL